MDEFLQGLMAFSSQMGEMMGNVEELTANLKDLALVGDAFFGTNTLEKVFQNFDGDRLGIGAAVAKAIRAERQEELLKFVTYGWNAFLSDLDKKAVAAKAAGAAASHRQRTEYRPLKPEFTSLEKMGFIMSGAKVQNPYDVEKVSLLRKLVENTTPRRHYPPPMDPRNANEIESIQTMELFSFNRI